MSCKRCSECEISLPLGVIYCPKCKRETWLHYGPQPDPEWENYKEDPITAFSEVPIIAQGRIIEYNNQFWIADEALDSVGYTGLRMVGTLVSTLGTSSERIYFELGGRAHLPDIELRGWWIVRMPTPDEMFRDLDVIQGTDPDGNPYVPFDPRRPDGV